MAEKVRSESTESIEALARRQHEAWNARDFDAIVELTHPDATLTLAGSGEVLRGKEGARRYAQMWAEGFPDGKITEATYIAQGNTVCSEFIGRGTQTGPLNGPAGTIPPTGKSITLPYCEVMEFKGDKLIALRAYTDMAGLLTQLGVMPALAKART